LHELTAVLMQRSEPSVPRYNDSALAPKAMARAEAEEYACKLAPVLRYGPTVERVEAFLRSELADTAGRESEQQTASLAAEVAGWYLRASPAR
jgi:hypothetical protein